MTDFHYFRNAVLEDDGLQEAVISICSKPKPLIGNWLVTASNIDPGTRELSLQPTYLFTS